MSTRLQRVIEQVRLREERRTLLAVCPNSGSVVRAALRAAREAEAPLLFAATLNQVDLDGGYTGWTPASFTEFVRQESEHLRLTVPVLPCLDHGGPWKKDRHLAERWPFEKTFAAARASIAACLDAGYALLHLDTTVTPDLPPDHPDRLDRVVERTLELLTFSETYRKEKNLPPVDYEVGSEEVKGGVASPEAFARFLEKLDAALQRQNLAHAWPLFVVGQVGTNLGTKAFDAAVAQQLTAQARRFGAMVKGHYTDNVANPEAYPLAGMGGANVGPELTETEYDALRELAALERKLGADSGLLVALHRAVEASGRWRKWLTAEERDRELRDLPEARQTWLVRTGSRYVWTDPEVKAARHRLYENVAPVRDAEAYVCWRLQTDILRYFHAFHLIGTARK